MDISLMGTWHYEFWHLGIGMVIMLVGTLALIAAIIFVPDHKNQRGD